MKIKKEKKDMADVEYFNLTRWLGQNYPSILQEYEEDEREIVNGLIEE